MRVSNQNTISNAVIPELEFFKKGKVRDMYKLDSNRLLMVTTDRVSCFDRVLNEPIPNKGDVLAGLAMFWFNQSKKIVRNHIISMPDPCVFILRKCTPINVEFVVRGYMAGSLGRDYAAGKREKCGVELPEGLRENTRLPRPIITPTTKGDHDKDTTPAELVENGLITRALWQNIESICLELFEMGQKVADQRGLILVDTKYEFGLDENNELMLIDEIHTPDSSRYWYKSDYAFGKVRQLDKEFLRDWLRGAGFAGEGVPPVIPANIQQEVGARYLELFEQLTGEPIKTGDAPKSQRVIYNLREAGIIRGCYVPIIMGSDKDTQFIEKIAANLNRLNIPHGLFVASGHKSPLKVLSIIEKFNNSIEPIVAITVAGRSNALSGLVAANSNFPVIACPPFKDLQDYSINIHSTLQMPSDVPVMTVIDPGNAALAAARILGK